MSYILDALRKADAQRERDPALGIHAHSTPLGASASPAVRPTWWWGAAAVVIAAVAWTGWWWVQDKNAPSPAMPVAQTNAAPAAVPTVAAGVAPAPATAASLAAPAAAAAIVPPPPSVPVETAAPSHGMRALQARQSALGRAMPPPPEIRPTPPVPTAAPVATSNSAVAAPVPSAAGLPPDAPRAAISGGVYSTSPAQRMLIVNGQVFNEGSEVAPGLAIDEIGPRTAVLKFRGARYTVVY